MAHSTVHPTTNRTSFQDLTQPQQTRISSAQISTKHYDYSPSCVSNSLTKSKISWSSFVHARTAVKAAKSAQRYNQARMVVACDKLRVPADGGWVSRESRRGGCGHDTFATPPRQRRAEFFFAKCRGPSAVAIFLSHTHDGTVRAPRVFSVRCAPRPSYPRCPAGRISTAFNTSDGGRS